MGLFGKKKPPAPVKSDAQLMVEEMTRRLQENTANNGKIIEQVRDQLESLKESPA